MARMHPLTLLLFCAFFMSCLEQTLVCEVRHVPIFNSKTPYLGLTPSGGDSLKETSLVVLAQAMTIRVSVLCLKGMTIKCSIEKGKSAIIYASLSIYLGG